MVLSQRRVGASGLPVSSTGPGCDDFGRACAATEDLVVIDEFFPLPVDAGAQV
ncbi:MULTISPECIES: hypothetical protein [Microbacterium]|uniref:hypothetical protein n=1 Tax=Microbacterium TaxID=33882 RepID=UPI001C628AAB|nr:MULTISPECIES: hypothetical protein [Microbacterium]QYG10672.1 hypothetical protein KY497_10130 [Microbacterium sp. PAMC22086]WKT89043.1 hypothetical protein QYR02_16640 [Microbacterium liquefaciens]